MDTVVQQCNRRGHSQRNQHGSAEEHVVLQQCSAFCCSGCRALVRLQVTSSDHVCNATCVQQALGTAQTEATQRAAEAARAEAEKAHLMHQLLQSDTNGVKMADALELAGKEVKRALTEATKASHEHLLSSVQQARSDAQVALAEQARLAEQASTVEAAMEEARADLEASFIERSKLVLRCERVEAHLHGTLCAHRYALRRL